MNIDRLDPGERQDNDDCQQRQRSGHRGWPAILRTAPESQVRSRLPAGGKWIRTIGPPPEIVVDPSGSSRDHRAKCGCLSARLPMDKITGLDTRFRYLRAIGITGVM